MAPCHAANIHSQKNVQFATGASQSVFQADPTEDSSGMIYQQYGQHRHLIYSLLSR